MGAGDQKEETPNIIVWGFELVGIKAIKCRNYKQLSPNLSIYANLGRKEEFFSAPSPPKSCPVR